MNKSIIRLIMIIIVIIFISSYIIASTGYYEYTMRERTIITNEKIKEFEEDIRNNKDVDIKDYYDNKELDYSNKITTLVYNVSDNSNKLARKAIKYLFKKLSTLVEE